jgi:hypothetical protein
MAGPSTVEMNTKGEILGIVISMTVLAILALALRLFTRFLIIKKPALEDAFIVTAMVCVSTPIALPREF